MSAAAFAAMLAQRLPPQVQLTLPGIIQQQALHWTGPYPPPEAVERYEQVLPGAFNRMVTMAEEEELQAQIAQSELAMRHTQSDNRRGIWLGFATTIIAMAGTVGCAMIGYPWLGAAFLSVPVMAVAKALIESARAPSSTDIVRAAAESASAVPAQAGPSQDQADGR